MEQFPCFGPFPHKTTFNRVDTIGTHDGRFSFDNSVGDVISGTARLDRLFSNLLIVSQYPRNEQASLPLDLQLSALSVARLALDKLPLNVFILLG